MRILCAGDLHIGRRSSRIPATLDASLASATAAWRRIVELAISRQADVVALSGDLVDERNKFFEAVVPLRDGIRELTRAGINVVAVSGNHDHDVLPRIAAEVKDERFHFLGAGGKWEAQTIAARGAMVRFVGYSFPSESVTHEPLDSIGSLASSDLPTIGIVHGDLNASSSKYAPL